MIKEFLKRSELDIYLFNEGKNRRSYNLFGAHFHTHDGLDGIEFIVWAPNAKSIALVGDFNNWQGDGYEMSPVEKTGVWQIFIPNLLEAVKYKYKITTQDGRVLMKSDPFAFYSELRPNTASITYNLEGYEWQDSKWLTDRKKKNHYKSPMNIYEVHLGSWRHNDQNKFLSYREMADHLVAYVKEFAYTHVEILPLNEHPYDGSWGYQATGYYSITSRYGEPKDFMYLVDQFHKHGISVIIDWVPCHFCNDEHGLREFDGTKLYEHVDPKYADNETWGTTNFDYGKTQIKSFLISNALFLFDKFHIDGLRVDAVAFMLYQGYSTCHSEQNNFAVQFLQELNAVVFEAYPNALMIAEESSAWPLVTSPTSIGGLGFNFKWNMGWMNDMLVYVKTDHNKRSERHKAITFSVMYAFTENFVLPLSHDEVVHGKKSLLNKMPGDYWQQFADLRMFYGYMYAYPGKKLLFMGGEFGQYIEWDENRALDWFIKENEKHSQMSDFVKKLNHFYKTEPSFYINDDSYKGFEWIDFSNHEQSIISFVRNGENGEHILVVNNFTPAVYPDYDLGVPQMGKYVEVFNTDAIKFGGSGYGDNSNLLTVKAQKHGRPQSIKIDIAPLATMYFKYIPEEKEEIIDENV